VKIAILGAGVVGVTSAWYLVQAGHEVVVVDRAAEPAAETSFANGGHVAAGHAGPWAKPSLPPKLLRWLGREDAPVRFRMRADRAQWEWVLRFLGECLPARCARNTRALSSLAVFSRECLRTLRSRTGIRYDELARGILYFYTAQREFDAAARHAGSAARTAAECLALEPALKDSQVPVVGGVLSESDESGDARKFTLELARICGAELRLGTTIEALEVAGDRISSARLAGGERLAADAFVVCLGSYSPLLLAPAGIRIPVYPLKGYSITLKLGPAEAESAPMVSLNDEEQKIVISRLGDRLRAAGTAELAGYDTSISATRCNAILHRIRQLFPGLGSISYVERWAGLRPATPGNVPIIGRTRYRNLYLNTGHGTLGWTLACGSAHALAEIVSGKKPEVDFRFLS
jgi:D-amino-acid dehydrogenase